MMKAMTATPPMVPTMTAIMYFSKITKIIKKENDSKICTESTKKHILLIHNYKYYW